MTPLGLFGSLAAIVLIAVVFIDTFEVMLLPRRVRHAYRPARIYYRAAWILWRAAAQRLSAGKWRNGLLSAFGPFSLLVLVGLWGTCLILGFALLHDSVGTHLTVPGGSPDFLTYVYFSGTTFFTLGYGDIVPTGEFGRGMSVIEAGVGFSFLAVVISYLPILYQAFSRREIIISLLDARAGSPPTAGELLRRLGDAHRKGDICATLTPTLVEWERWSAELLESHLSYPVLRFYRSQHDNQSWVGALTTILDTCSILIAGVEGSDNYQPRLTFAMARHAAVDLSLASEMSPTSPPVDRLPAIDLTRLRESLRQAGLPMRDEAAFGRTLTELRHLYEPFVYTMAMQLQFSLPAFLPSQVPVDNWQTSPGMPRSPDLGRLRATSADEHFD
jgi:Ion channel